MLVDVVSSMFSSMLVFTASEDQLSADRWSWAPMVH